MESQATMYDILIRCGTLFDGSGRPGVPGDILIADGRIAAIGHNLDGTACKTIDAEGLAVAPGFIDIKTICRISPRFPISKWKLFECQI